MQHHRDSSLREVAEGRLFTIPDYQRPYAWDSKQLQDLWEDLDLMGPKGSHYTGTLVLLSRDAETGPDGASFEECEVVDGQQRLTSLLLLIDRLRRRLETLNQPEATRLAAQLRDEFGDVQHGWNSRPRIRLAGELNTFWHKSILQDQPLALAGLHSGHRLLRQAVELFDSWIDDLARTNPTSSFAPLQDLTNRVTNGLRFLVYEVSSAADVGVIFETLNDRGRDLTELEKIKNYLLYLGRQMPDHAREELVTHINRAWSRIFDSLAAAPGVNEDSVLRAHWIVTQDGDARRWKGTRSVKARFPRVKYVDGRQRLSPFSTESRDDPEQTLRDDIVGYVDTLERCALYAQELHSIEAQLVDFTDHHDEARRAGHKLRNAGHGLVRFYPILFAARLAHPHDGHFYARMVQLCEVFVVRIFLVTQWRTHTGSSSINRHGHDLLRYAFDPATALSRFASLIRYYADDDRMGRSLSSFSDWYGRPRHKFLLYEYELSCLPRGSTPPSFSHFVAKRRETTEHILPQSPGAGSQWRRDFTEEQRKVMTHTLGNLMLTMDNSRYSNHDYVVKRGSSDTATEVACYRNGSLAQERKVATEYEEWTPETIQHRQASLATWIVQRWPLPEEPAPEPQVTEDEAYEDASMDDVALDESALGDGEQGQA